MILRQGWQVSNQNLDLPSGSVHQVMIDAEGMISGKHYLFCLRPNGFDLSKGQRKKLRIKYYPVNRKT